MSKLKLQIKDSAQIFVLLVKTFFRDQGVVNAAALTYTTLFAIVPLMTVSYAMLAAIPSFQGVGSQVESWIFQNFIPSTGSVVQDYLAGFASQAKSLTVVGLFFLFVTAILMIKNIEAAFNRIWHIKSGRRGLNSFLIYWAVLTLGPLLVGVGLGLSSYLVGLARLDKLHEISGFRLLELLPWLMTAAAFSLIYAIVPNCRVPWRAALVSGVIAALIFELAKRGFGFFISNFPSYQLIYGAFAAVPLFLVWIYICWSIILLGAMLSRILAGRSEGQGGRQPSLPRMMEVLDRLAQFQRRGDAFSLEQLEARLPSLGRQSVEPYLELLTPLKIVTQDGQSRYVVRRDLSQVKLADVAALFPMRIWVDRDKSDGGDWRELLALRQQEVLRAEQPILEMNLQDIFDLKTGQMASSQSPDG